MKEKVEGLVSKSDERPLRVVIDEELPGDSVRILISEMKPAKKANVADFNVWEEEEELYVTKDELAGMLDEKQMRELREGQVFRVMKRKAENLHEEVRKKMKEKTEPLLKREGQEGKP